jgi:hypothetical protein
MDEFLNYQMDCLASEFDLVLLPPLMPYPMLVRTARQAPAHYFRWSVVDHITREYLTWLALSQQPADRRLESHPSIVG